MLSARVSAGGAGTIGDGGAATRALLLLLLAKPQVTGAAAACFETHAIVIDVLLTP